MAPRRLVQRAKTAPMVTIHLTVYHSILSKASGNGAFVFYNCNSNKILVNSFK